MDPASLPRIVTADQMRAIDERAIKGMGIPGLTLMENAGRGIATAIRDQIFDGDAAGQRVGIVCGRGNNGGDGFVVGRYLAEWGAEVSFHLIGSPEKLKGDAEINYDRAIKAGLTVSEVSEDRRVPEFVAFDLLVDAIFGTGFHGPVRGLAEMVIDAMNDSGVRIVAVDMPSGLSADDGEASGSIIRANYTNTLACSKLGQWLWPGRAFVGNLRTIDIGIPEDAVAAQGVDLGLISEEAVRAWLPKRPPEGHKGTFGKALIVGGSVGMSGAVALAAQACLRSGAGLAYAGVPSSLADTVDAQMREAVILPFPEVQKRRALARRGLGEIIGHFDHVGAVAIGPGVGRHYETQELVRRLILRRSRPTVLDADGLNAAAAQESAVLESESDVPLILTPHAGEMARLLGRSVPDIVADRKQAAVEAAVRFGAIVVMKGAPTFVADPTGATYLNPTGNAGMGSGGAGDVLTGVIVSFLAQGVDPLVAALLGVYIHGLAGDFAAAETGERSLVASDVVDSLPDVLQFLDE